MNYLITAAGKGSRFLKKCIKPPKPLIKVFGNELLIWSMSSFNFKSEDNIYIVTYKHHYVKEKIENKIKKIYPDISISWLELSEIFNGQLITAIKAIEFFEIDGPLIIHNCDTFHKYPICNKNFLFKDDLFGIIPCFKAEGENWSFVKSDSNDPYVAIEVKEKVRISENCSVGTYVFSSAKNLLLLAKEYLENRDRKLSEYYIAPIFQYAIEKKLKVKIEKTNSVKVFGTPKELLNSFSITFNQLLGENALNGNQTKTLVIDIDKTICKKNDKDDYAFAIPIKKVCNAIRKAHEEGAYIVLFTSRNMRTFQGSLGLINKITAPLIIKWLSDNKIPYDEIYFGKPWGHMVSYIDDKSISIENFIKKFKSN